MAMYNRDVGCIVGLLDAIQAVSIGGEVRGEVSTLQPLVHEAITRIPGWRRLEVRGSRALPDGVYEYVDGTQVCVEMKLLRSPFLLTSSEPRGESKVLGMVSVDALSDEDALVAIHEMASNGCRGVQPGRPSLYKTEREWRRVLDVTVEILRSTEAAMLWRPFESRQRTLTYESTIADVLEDATGQASTYARSAEGGERWHLVAAVAAYVGGRTFWFVSYTPRT